MATNTDNYRFKKPSYADLADIAVLNENMETLDAKLHEVEQTATANSSGLTQLRGRLSGDEETIAALKTSTEQGLESVRGYAAQKVAEATDACTEAVRSNNALRNRVEEAESKVNTLRHDIVTIMDSVDDAIDNAAVALGKAVDVENDMATFSNQVTAIRQSVETLRSEVKNKLDDAYVEGGYLYVTAEGEIKAGPLGPMAGGGGGGGSGSETTAKFTVENRSGWTGTTVSDGAPCVITLYWAHTEDELPTGNGSITINVNKVNKKVLQNVKQGVVEIDVSPYLSVGNNDLILTVANSYGETRRRAFNIEMVALSLTSSLDTSSPFTGVISVPYVPVGNVSKTVHFLIDDKEVGTVQTAISGRQMSYIIPKQSYGAHILTIYFDAEVNGQTISSNTLRMAIMCTDSTSTAPIISTAFNTDSIPRFGQAEVVFQAYDPMSLTAPIVISVDGNTVSQQTVDRTQQRFVWRGTELGEHTLSIVIASEDPVSWTHTITVEDGDIDIEAETEALALHLSSAGRSNNEESRAEWKDGDIEATLTGFNWTSDGWVQDEDGNTCLRVSGDARVTIPYQIFAKDFRATGKTIELDFRTRDVRNYDTTILSCMSEGRGLTMTAQSVNFASEQSKISTQFKEDEHLRVGFVVEKRTENRLIFSYIDGIISGVVRYPEADDFSQATPVGISIGSNDCTIDIYGIRIYDNDLTRYQMVNNFIADTLNVDEMVDRYARNNIYNAYGDVTIAGLPSDLPYLVFEGDALPQYKGNKLKISGRFIDPVHPERNFTFEDADIDVQGTSSQYYWRKNYKVKFKNGFILENGAVVKAIQVGENEIPVSVICFKADVASSEGANNVELARLYDQSCPYKTPAQEKDSRVHQAIDGFPIVIFWGDQFLGKYNFNVDKSAEAYFGFEEGDESWEIKNNTSDRVLFKSNDFSGTAWLNDFEARYPDTDPAYADATQLKAFADWIVSTNRDEATDEDLTESVTYDDVTYTKDTAEYRLAKFRAELGDYVEVESAKFFYLFTELFLMVDSRAKNLFPSFVGTSVE